MKILLFCLGAISFAHAASVTPQLDLGYGASTNATRINEGPGGGFAKADVQVTGEATPSEFWSLYGGGRASVKRFLSTEISDLADESTFGLDAEVLFIPDINWEIGLSGYLDRTIHHAPSVGDDGPVSELHRYWEPGARASALTFIKDYSLEFGGLASERMYSTFTEDVRGNSFEDSYTDWGGDIEAGYFMDRSTKAHLRTRMIRKDYHFRNAEYSDGLPVAPGVTNPKLSVLTWENRARYRWATPVMNFDHKLFLSIDNDTVFGARDATEWKTSHALEMVLPYTLAFKPEVSLSRKAFDTYVSDPEGNPRFSDLRVDWTWETKAPLSWSLGGELEAKVEYAFDRYLTNLIQETYSEHRIETGIHMSL